MWLPVADIAGRHHRRRQRQSCSPDAHFSQRPCTRCHDGPAIWRQGSEQLQRPRKGYHTIQILHFHAFNPEVLGLMIGIRQEFTNNLEAGSPVRLTHRLFWLKAMLKCPLLPHSGNGRSGIYKNTIQIEKNRPCGNEHSGMITYQTRCEAVGRTRCRLTFSAGFNSVIVNVHDKGFATSLPSSQGIAND